MIKIMTLEEDKKLVDILREIQREGKALTTQVWFSESIESALFKQMVYGESNVPYIGVEMRAFELDTKEIAELSYKKEQYRKNFKLLEQSEEHYLVMHLKLGEEFCFFGADPKDVIFITK